MTAMLNMEEASKLLDFTQKLDIGLLDNIVTCLYSSQGEPLRLAQDVLTTLKGKYRTIIHSSFPFFF